MCVYVCMYIYIYIYAEHTSLDQPGHCTKERLHVALVCSASSSEGLYVAPVSSSSSSEGLWYLHSLPLLWLLCSSVPTSQNLAGHTAQEPKPSSVSTRWRWPLSDLLFSWFVGKVSLAQKRSW